MIAQESTLQHLNVTCSVGHTLEAVPGTALARRFELTRRGMPLPLRLTADECIVCVRMYNDTAEYLGDDPEIDLSDAFPMKASPIADQMFEVVLVG